MSEGTNLAGEEFVQPLAEFYAQAGMPLPHIEQIEGARMPEPYRTLLVHERDMTPTLEQHHGCRIHLRVLRSERQGNEYHREVVLRLDHSDKPVEFGANRVALDLYPTEARNLILREYVPLGTILARFNIVHTCHPSAYLRITADPLISRELQVTSGATLYGRRNTLRNPQGRDLSDIVEILP
jgi:chorismate-pyruvate lyase